MPCYWLHSYQAFWSQHVEHKAIVNSVTRSLAVSTELQSECTTNLEVASHAHMILRVSDAVSSAYMHSHSQFHARSQNTYFWDQIVWTAKALM